MLRLPKHLEEFLVPVGRSDVLSWDTFSGRSAAAVHDRHKLAYQPLTQGDGAGKGNRYFNGRSASLGGHYGTIVSGNQKDKEDAIRAINCKFAILIWRSPG